MAAAAGLRVVVIGAGFSGTMIAVHLASQTQVRVDVCLLERTGRFGAGVAYSTPFECHRLNVPTARMSAFPDAPRHFLRWAQARDERVLPDAFLPRQWYAAYLADVLDDAVASAPRRGNRVRRIDAEAVALERRDDGSWRVAAADGAAFDGDAIVLAIGNYPPSNPTCETPEFYDSARYRSDPWAPDALVVDAQEDVLMLGTGLTMIDVVLALDAQGHRGHLTAVSRRGALPHWLRGDAREPHDVRPPVGLDEWPKTMRRLVRGVRREIGANARAGGDWRDVIASLRSSTPAIWRALSLDDRRRFLRHVRPYWDTRRHGAAPAIGRKVDSLRASGRLDIVTGRVLRYDLDGDGVVVVIRRRGRRDDERRRVQRIINCTGPDADVRRVTSALVRALVERRAIAPDPLGLGIVTEENGRVIDGDGRANDGLYLTGPLRRGQSWENYAVPELRREAADLARHLTDERTVRSSGPVARS